MIALLLAAAAFSAQPIQLVRDGKSPYAICISEKASPSEKRGAEELQRFLQEISGARLPILTDRMKLPSHLVLVGASRALDRVGVRIPFDDLGAEGFALKTAGRHLAIAGGRQRGTMYGVYTFLEKLGCRWFSSGVSRIPKMRTITIQPLDEIQKPAFEYREPFVTEAFDKDWAARNKTNGGNSRLDDSTGGKVRYYPFVHSFYQMIPPEKYFKDHPEYFSLIDGKRRVERGQLCLTNPEVLRLGIAAVENWIRLQPDAAIYSVSQNDWEGWCECDNCRRVEQEEGGQHSGPILRFVNALAAEIEKKHPDKLIDTLAYWYSENPPLKVRPRPNVRIRLCPIGVCEAHPYETCPRSAYFMRNLRAWAAITNQLYIWHYNTNFSHYLVPFPDFDELAADIPLYRRYGVVGIFLEGSYPKGGGGENAELRSYVMARLLWDPKTDVNHAVEEFLEGYYGPAARPMRAYFDLLHGEARRGMHIWINPVPEFSAGFLPKAKILFQQAEAAAPDEAIRRRVRKARLSIDYLELLRARTFQVEDKWYGPRDLPGLTDRFQSFLAAVRGFGITSLHEGRDLSTDEKEFAAIRRYAAVTLENPALRLDVVPELGGRVIRMLDKASGRDALRRPDSGERGYPDLGGLLVSAYPDYHGRTWDTLWRVDSASSGELRLIGDSANGLRLERKIQLLGSVVHTETVARNRSASPLELVLQSRADFDPGNIDDVVVAFRGKVVSLAEMPTGSETFAGADRPDSEWRVANQPAGLVLRNRFFNDQVSRCFLSWSAKGPHRVTLGIWSQKRILTPGDTLELQADYSF